MKELMTSSRSSRITTLAVLLVLSLAAVAPAAAVSVDDTSIPGEAEAGTQVSASVTLSELFVEPNWDPWTLRGETELQNVTWTVTYIDQTGNEFDTQSYDGQQLNGGNGVTVSTDNNVKNVRVEIVGDVPRPEEFTYPEKETFTVMELTQTRGSEGSRSEIDTWTVHHYTTGADDEPGSKQARTAIAEAQGAINSAETAGADVTEANRSLQNAIEFYESDNGNFENAIENANTAKQQANDAEKDAKNSAQTTQLLIYAGVAILLIALVGGGYWYYQQQQDSYDKLG
jgi:flagellar basal body-associated protein FliL